MIEISPCMLTLIESVEGRRSKIYQCGAGHWTIGIGHKLTRDELEMGAIKIDGKLVQWRQGLTDEQIDALARQDIEAACWAIISGVRVPLTECQRSALASFVFNVGINAFRESTLLKKLNEGDYDSVPRELGRWVHATTADRQKIRLKGLEGRRAQEVAMWRGEVA
jgi:lysozyme